MFSSISKGMFRRPTRESTFPYLENMEGTLIRGNVAPQTVNSQDKGRQNNALQSNMSNDRICTSANSMSNRNRSNEDDERIIKKDDVRMNSTLGNCGPRIISVGGGKGGIGKSFFSANIAVCLTRLGYKVALVDLDLGAANLHTCLGVPSPKVGLFDFVSNRVDNLEEVAVSGGVPGLTLYGGGQEFWQQIRPHSVQKIRLISKLQRLDADYVILDLGAGTHVNTLDFFIFSHAGIVVVVPEPTSIENAYVFLKSVLFRKLQSVIKAIRQEEVSEKLMTALGDPKITIPPLAQLQKFALEEPEVGQKILQLIQMTQLGVAMNQIRTKTDMDIGSSITQISKRYFGFNAEYLGAISYDDAAWKSVRNRRPLCVDFPDTAVSQSVEKIAEMVCLKFLPPLDNRMMSEAK